MSDIIFLIFKTTLIFLVLLILTRILGKKQMSHLTFFNYITGITIGSIAANVISKANKNYYDDIIGLIWWCVLTIVLEYISLKSGKIRSIIDDQPTILVKKGKINRHALAKNRMNMDDLSMLLRHQSVFSITEVDYAILEADGSISILKKPEQQHLTKLDMKICVSEKYFIPTEIIVDGKVIAKNLKELNLSENWLNNQLKQSNVISIQDVFYAEIQKDGTLFIDKY